MATSWPKPIVRATVHFHNLRHTTGSLLTQARVPIAAVAAVLGHSQRQPLARIPEV